MRIVIRTQRGYLLSRHGGEFAFTHSRDLALSVSPPTANTICAQLALSGLIGEVVRYQDLRV